MPEFKPGDRVRSFVWPEWFAAKVIDSPIPNAGDVAFEVVYVSAEHRGLGFMPGDRARMSAALLEHLD
ncbi:hypothetical protein SEA_CLOWN_54 [Gordonia phage Clown]|uniref:Uncharacterized protein n=1 Tax=Gordonia phage Clown TaxID=2759393 RepID=A0A7L7SHZ2_9CAUD|nr:hypothetical protein KNV25_gp54 [Gordonia phage Clown]QOC56052.1 hypothetical protein SEA_CLOWN_54 [Gordonia phage Clown]